MSKRDLFFSSWSCGLTLILILGVAAALVGVGAQMFSPGPLTAVHPQNRPLQGFKHHADFEAECNRCHQPLQGPMAGLCLACHTSVAGQIQQAVKLHGVFQEVDHCLACHPDHLGREVRITRLNSLSFSHEAATNFSLIQHSVDYAGRPISCAACHPQAGYDFEASGCVECHTAARPDFMAAHQAGFGADCLVCHRGRGSLDAAGHAAFFPLEGAHAAAGCLECHTGRQFTHTPRACYSCHRADDVHQSRPGTACDACHRPSSWAQVRLNLASHVFPLAHKNEGRPLACAVCHPDAFTRYSCYGCHEHNPAEIASKHLEEGLRNFQNCAACHPTGREHKDDEPAEAEDD